MLCLQTQHNSPPGGKSVTLFDSLSETFDSLLTNFFKVFDELSTNLTKVFDEL